MTHRVRKVKGMEEEAKHALHRRKEDNNRRIEGYVQKVFG